MDLFFQSLRSFWAHGVSSDVCAGPFDAAMHSVSSSIQRGDGVEETCCVLVSQCRSIPLLQMLIATAPDRATFARFSSTDVGNCVLVARSGLEFTAVAPAAQEALYAHFNENSEANSQLG